jgi:hypothetical protein
MELGCSPTFVVGAGLYSTPASGTCVMEGPGTFEADKFALPGCLGKKRFMVYSKTPPLRTLLIVAVQTFICKLVQVAIRVSSFLGTLILGRSLLSTHPIAAEDCTSKGKSEQLPFRHTMNAFIFLEITTCSQVMPGLQLRADWQKSDPRHESRSHTHAQEIQQHFRGHRNAA